jgi:hypothetical protein
MVIGIESSSRWTTSSNEKGTNTMFLNPTFSDDGSEPMPLSLEG